MLLTTAARRATRTARATRVAAAVGLALALTASALSAPQVSAVAAEAAGRPTYHRINSNPGGQDGLEVWKGGCTAQGFQIEEDQFSFGYGNGQPFPYGPLSVAWTPDVVDLAVALRAFTKTPAEVDIFDVQVFHRARKVKGLVTTTYVPDANAGVPEEWLGYAVFNDTKSGWHPIRASEVTYTWVHFVNGVQDGERIDPSTLAVLASNVGTERDEAHMGFGFGCDRKVTYVDGLRLGSTDTGWDVYDMVGKPSDISLKVANPGTTCQVSAERYPGTVRVSGRISGLKKWAIWRLDEKGRVVRRITKFKTSRTEQFQRSFKLKRSSSIVAFAQNTDTTEAAVSNAVRVAAVPQIDFASRGRRGAVVDGDLRVSGRVEPGGRVPYTVLYTHWTGSSWTPFRAVGEGRTAKDGRFRVQAPTGTLGFSRVLILTEPTKKVNAALSRTAVTYNVGPRPTRGPSNFDDSSQPQTTETAPLEPAPTPTTPDTGGETEPDPIPEPGRVIVEKPSKGGYGVCGWKPPRSRP